MQNCSLFVRAPHRSKSLWLLIICILSLVCQLEGVWTCVYEGASVWTCMCVLKRTHCWYAVERNVWGAGFDGVLGLGGEEGVLGDPVYIIFRHFYSTSPTAFVCFHPSLPPGVPCCPDSSPLLASISKFLIGGVCPGRSRACFGQLSILVVSDQCDRVTLCRRCCCLTSIHSRWCLQWTSRRRVVFQML